METARRPTQGEVEQRAAPDLLATEGRKIRGRIPYGIESRDLGGWREVIEPGALTRTKLDDLVATVDHAGVPLGPLSRARCELEDRARRPALGRRRRRRAAADVREAVERGDLQRRLVADGRQRKDGWHGDVRHVQEIAELRDVSIVDHVPPTRPRSVEYRSPNTNPAAGQEEIMATRPCTQPTHQSPLARHRARAASRRPASLRVEERAEVPPFGPSPPSFESSGLLRDSPAIGHLGRIHAR